MTDKGWIIHCRTAFITEAKARYYKRKNKHLDLILHELSVESKIPCNILKKWWYENKHEIELPLCKNCNKNHIELHRGKPRTEKSAYFGLCATCRHSELGEPHPKKRGKNG